MDSASQLLKVLYEFLVVNNVFRVSIWDPERHMAMRFHLQGGRSYQKIGIFGKQMCFQSESRT
eukprot:6188406-Pleurochrysis_carterae.AAC.1